MLEIIKKMESMIRAVSERSGLSVASDVITAIVYLSKSLSVQLGNTLIQNILTAADGMNKRRNRIMGTNDGIDSYDIFRGIVYDEELSRLFTPPQFPYQIDPDPTIRPLQSLTLGAKAALSSYYKAFSNNVQKLSTEEINREMTVMGLTPNARLDLSRQLLISEVDRRINQEILSFPKVDFLDLLNILARIVQRYKSH